MRTLAGGPPHGYVIAKRVKGSPGEFPAVEEGSLYPALNRIGVAGIQSKGAFPQADAFGPEAIGTGKAGVPAHGPRALAGAGHPFPLRRERHPRRTTIGDEEQHQRLPASP